MVTAYVDDARFDRHTLEEHPESARRLQAIRRVLATEGLAARLMPLDIRPASEEALRAVHSAAYLAQLERTAAARSLIMMGPDTYITPESYAIARLTAGGAVQAVDAVLRGEAANALAALRPPGHHATYAEGMGFCLLNNVAIAVRHAQAAHGIERVAIVDYDVHHGNGTQDIFYADPSVLYVSTHQYPLYPGTGAVREMGEGIGEGYTVNIPLPPGTGDMGYTQAFEAIVLPALRRFVPGLILVSIGFDAHWVDPLANMNLSLTGYGKLTRALFEAAQELCQGRIVFVLEGGYDLDVLSHGWANVARVLLGDRALPDPIGLSAMPEPAIESLVERVRRLHRLD